MKKRRHDGEFRQLLRGVDSSRPLKLYCQNRIMYLQYFCKLTGNTGLKSSMNYLQPVLFWLVSSNLRPEPKFSHSGSGARDGERYVGEFENGVVSSIKKGVLLLPMNFHLFANIL